MTNQTNYLHQQARRAIDATMLSMISDDLASRVTSAADRRQVWLTVWIVATDELVVLNWRTSQGIEVAPTVYLRIDHNLPVLLAAIAAAEVNA